MHAHDDGLPYGAAAEPALSECTYVAVFSTVAFAESRNSAPLGLLVVITMDS